MIDEAAVLGEHNETERLQVIADAAAAAAIEATKAQEAADAQAAAEAAEAARAAKVKAAAVRTTATTVARTFTSPTYTAPARSSSGIGEAIAECESGGSYTAANPSSTASGKYQFLDSTWDGYGGYARAKDAPPAVQEAAFADLYASQGTTPWNASRHCWG